MFDLNVIFMCALLMSFILLSFFCSLLFTHNQQAVTSSGGCSGPVRRSHLMCVKVCKESSRAFSTHVFRGGSGFGESARVSLKRSQLLARAPTGDAERSAHSRSFLNSPLPCSARTPLLFFFPLQTSCQNVFLPQTQPLPRLNPPCSLRAPNGALGDISLDPCGFGRSGARGLLVWCAGSGDRRGGRATMLRPWAAHWIAAVLLCGAVAQYSSDQCSWRGRWGWRWTKDFWSSQL